MRIWIITPGEPAVFHAAEKSSKMMRSGALAMKLAERGHEVTWWTGAFQHHNKTYLVPAETLLDTEIENLKLWLISSPGYDKNFSYKRFVDYKAMANNWSAAARTQEVPDIIVASWPPIDLAFEAVKYARNVGAKIVTDSRDLWPDIIYERIQNLVRVPVPRFLRRYERMTKSVFTQSDAVFGVTDAYVKWARDKAGLPLQPMDRSFFLSSTKLAEIDPDAASEADQFWQSIGLDKSDGRIVFIWVSSLADHRATRAFLERFSKLPPELARRAALVICGVGDLKGLSESYSAKYDHMYYAGFIGKQQYAQLLSMATYGLLSYDPTFDFINSIPNKVNEYLSGGVQVITNLDGEAYRLLKSSGVITLMQASDQTDFNAEMTALIDKGALDTTARDAVKNVYAQHFDSETIYTEMADHVEAIAKL